MALVRVRVLERRHDPARLPNRERGGSARADCSRTCSPARPCDAANDSPARGHAATPFPPGAAIAKKCTVPLVARSHTAPGNIRAVLGKRRGAARPRSGLKWTLEIPLKPLAELAAMPAAHHTRISLKLRELNQRFNSMDPSPFIDRDLDHDAEEFIVSSAREAHGSRSFELAVHPGTQPRRSSARYARNAVRSPNWAERLAHVRAILPP